MSVQDENLRIPSNDWRAYQGVLSRRVMAFIIDYAIVALLWIPAAVIVFFLGILTFGLASSCIRCCLPVSPCSISA